MGKKEALPSVMAAKRGDGGRAMLCERQGFEEIYCLFCVCISFLFERHKEGSLVILSYFIWKKERVGLIAFCLLSFGKGGIDLFSFYVLCERLIF